MIQGVTDQPCAPWCEDADVTACGPCSAIDPATLPEAIEAASAWLWRLTGKIYGVCEVTVLPIVATPCDPCGPGYFTWGGSWFFDRARNCWYGSNSRMARGEGVPEIRLGFANVQSITQVAIDGTVLDSADYRVDDGRWLVRLDGQTWPITAPGDLIVSPPHFQVTLKHGLPIPPDGVRAASALACEIALACAAKPECRLPKRVQTITRQGVAMIVIDPLTLVDDGKFGVAEVDYFVKAVNPYGNRQRAKVLSPDVGRAVRIPTNPMLGPLP